MQQVIFENMDNQLYLELCHGLYERELLRLSNALPADKQRLALRLRGLSKNIQLAARHLMAQSQRLAQLPEPPLALDYHNVSWQGPQAPRPPMPGTNKDSLARWFDRHGQPGLVVPTLIQQPTQSYIELDSIDRVDYPGHRLHLNKLGWFDFDGSPIQTTIRDGQGQLIKPAIKPLVAGCCGHLWIGRHKTQPRTLSLRELLISCSIDWSSPGKVRNL